MKYKEIVTLLIAMMYLLDCFSQHNHRTGKEKRIIIEAQLPTNQFVDSLILESTFYDYVDIYPQWNVEKVKNQGGHVKWVLSSSKPLLIKADVLGRLERVVNPGDSVSITFNRNGKFYQGEGAEAFKLQDEIRILLDSMVKNARPTNVYVDIKSLSEYLKWQSYFDKQMELTSMLMETVKSKITPGIFELIKDKTIKNIEGQRVESFMALYYLNNRSSLLTNKELLTVFDTTMNESIMTNLIQTDYTGDVWTYYQYNRIQVWKKYGFDFNHDSIGSRNSRILEYYNSIKRNYKGVLRERVLQYIIADEVVKSFGYNHPLTARLLKDYYRQCNYKDYKLWMKNYEKYAAQKYDFSSANGDRSAPPFKLSDKEGNAFYKSTIHGKVALLFFWFSGCKGISKMNSKLRRLQEEFRDDTNVVFLRISTDVDKGRWLKNISKSKYEIKNVIDLYTEGQGVKHQMISDYNISSYPEINILNAKGELAHYIAELDKEDNDELVLTIRKLRAMTIDGPYVIYNKDSVSVSYVNLAKYRSPVETVQYHVKEVGQLNIMTDKFPKRFSVQLKKSLQNEPSVFEKPEKQLVVSDIEGNFDALRKLLQSNGVINESFDWIYGKGHLIFVGDMFDRGEQVTECLWLIYSLEEKAKRSGGYVHFILGNHEILNLSNDLRYVQAKYIESSQCLRRPYVDLYGNNSELGRWLRTKNIIEKVGNVLYVHAGISREINEMSLSIQDINNLIRPYYARRNEFKINRAEPNLRLLFNSKMSPFWYRGYYKNGKKSASMTQVDSTLRKFSVSYVVTGHTIIADTVSVHFDGKVINIDTKHAEGKSEALLVEGSKYYRVNLEGQKILLIDERSGYPWFIKQTAVR